MEKPKKRTNILAIILGVILVAVTTFGVLLYTGVVKSPMVKEKDCSCPKCTDTKTDNTKKTDTKTTDKVTETRYYQFVSEKYQQTDANGNPLYKTIEIELAADGTIKMDSVGTNDTIAFKGQYLETDEYIIALLNGTDNVCQSPEWTNACHEGIVLIKDGDLLLKPSSSDYEFKKDSTKTYLEFKKVNVSDLKTSIAE